jgi:hypothetical protein
MPASSPTPVDGEATPSIPELIRKAITDFTDAEDPNDPVEINGGYCRAFATFVVENYPVPDDIEIIDAWDVHTWLKHGETHYDAEIPDGTPNPHDFPVWNRPLDARLEIAGESCDCLSVSRLTEQ